MAEEYDQGPEGYDQGPEGYDQGPEGYDQGPEGYDQRRAHALPWNDLGLSRRSWSRISQQNRAASPSTARKPSAVTDSQAGHGLGNANSTSPIASVRGQGCGSKNLWLLRTSTDRCARCCPAFPGRLRTQHGPASGARQATPHPSSSSIGGRAAAQAAHRA
jgi:hypothetical protein